MGPFLLRKGERKSSSYLSRFGTGIQRNVGSFTP